MSRQAISRQNARTPRTRSVLMAVWRFGVRSLCVCLVGVTVSAQAPVEFDVASIKRNTSDRPTPTSGPPPLPGSGQLTLNWIPARFLVTRAFTNLTTPLVVEGLPGWADSERWDVAVKFRPGASPDEQAQMWLRLLEDRMKLQAHVETRPRPAYKLVLARADRRLGANLKPSTLACPPPDSTKRQEPSLEARDAMMATVRDRRAATPQEEALLLSQCTGSFNTWNNTMYAGNLEIRALPTTLALFGRLDRPVVDETGLQGRYSMKLWAAPATAGPPDPDAPPSLFTALQDQLGLKLEATTIDGRIVVVDHIERPTEN